MPSGLAITPTLLMKMSVILFRIPWKAFSLVMNYLQICAQLLTHVGLRGGVTYILHRKVGIGMGTLTRITPRHAQSSLILRKGTSDADVFRQIFLEQEYEPICGLKNVNLVIDCGANVGYSSAFFLTHFPQCRVIAVEPDPSNFVALRMNLLPYGERVTLVQAGIWSENVPLKVSKGQYRDGREWATQVRACESEEHGDLEGLSVGSLLAHSGSERISLLKMDIEGAEVVVFAGNLGWLEFVDVIVIELHDDSYFGKASSVFHSAIRGRGFDITHKGELTICIRRGLAEGDGIPIRRMPACSLC